MTDYKQLLKDGKLTYEEHALLSHIGFNLWMYSAHKDQKYYDRYLGAKAICAHFNKLSDYSLDISINNNFKGLRNYNKLSYTAYIN